MTICFVPNGTGHRSSSFPDVSIKKLFSLLGSAQESGMLLKHCKAADVRMIVHSPEPIVIDPRHAGHLHVRDDRSRLQRCIRIFIGSDDGINILSFRSVTIQIVPATATNTMSRPKASANMLFVLSGPEVMCRKNTR
jgi:hypothetical protein